jgi:hypothetical protein
VEELTQSIGGHWLTFTVPGRGLGDVLDVMGGRIGDSEQLRAYGHPRRVVHETGAQLYYGSDRDDQPIVVNLPGEVCEAEFDTGLAWCHQLGGNMTRVDLANDVGPDDLARGRWWDMVKEFKGGRVDTRMRRTSVETIQSERPGDGYTAYFGGKQSALMLRAYDRRGPLRLEFQWAPPKQSRRHIPMMLLEQGPGNLWRALAKDHVWPLSWYKRLVDGEQLDLPPDDPEAATTLAKAVDAIREQHGATLWALMTLGLTMGDLAKPPPDKIRGRDAMKLLGWARDARDMGGSAGSAYDGLKLEAEVRRRMKRARVVK